MKPFIQTFQTLEHAGKHEQHDIQEHLTQLSCGKELPVEISGQYDDPSDVFYYTFLVSRISFPFTLLHHLCGPVVRVPGYRSRGPGFDSQGYQILWEVVGLERGPLSLVRLTKELLEWKSSGSGQENRFNGRGNSLR
jgi:hypothetical protein